MTLDIKSQDTRAARGPATAEFGARVLAVEFDVEGHHPGYVHNFAQSWVRQQIPAYLDFLVTPKFLQLHSNVVDEVRELEGAGVRIMALTDEEYRRMERRGPKSRYFPGWKLYCDYARRLRAITV